MSKLLLSLTAFFISFSALATPTPLVDSIDLKAWYKTETSKEPGDFFGIYSIKYINDKIYLGFGTDRPAAQDGAMLASLPLQGGTPTNLAYLEEQGFIDMMVAGDYLHIPGADPAYPPFNWSSGNWYRFNLVEKTPKIELKRNLPFVVHGWGHWFDETTNTIYHATSQVTCPVPNENGGCFGVADARGHGALFTSIDMGDSWTRTGIDTDGLGTYRTYDIKGTNNSLFAVWADYTPEGSQCGVAVKKKLETAWKRVKYLTVPCLERLIVYKNRVLTLSNNGPFLVSVSEDYKDESPYDAVRLPARRVRGNFNHIAIGSNDEFIFASAEGIYKTMNLSDWELIPGTESITNTTAMTIIESTNTLLLATPEQVYKIQL